MKQHLIDRLLEARSLEPLPAEDAEVAAIWASALREWSDAWRPRPESEALAPAGMRGLLVLRNHVAQRQTQQRSG